MIVLHRYISYVGLEQIAIINVVLTRVYNVMYMYASPSVGLSIDAHSAESPSPSIAIFTHKIWVHQFIDCLYGKLLLRMTNKCHVSIPMYMFIKHYTVHKFTKTIKE